MSLCKECGHPFAPNGVGRPRKFCDDKCRARAGNRHHRRRLPPLRVSETRTCVACPTAFEATRRNHVYCSERCGKRTGQRRRRAGLAGPRQSTCDGCGTAYEAKTNRTRWCSRLCANRHYGNLRARQRARPSGDLYTDLEIFTRDGWVCHLCGDPVNRAVSRLHPDGATIDHLVPITRGGLDEPSNVATAHWRCNRAKGNSAILEATR
jgi:5-methylcytosine-specific restriction endonuclease McrA